MSATTIPNVVDTTVHFHDHRDDLGGVLQRCTSTLVGANSSAGRYSLSNASLWTCSILPSGWSTIASRCERRDLTWCWPCPYRQLLISANQVPSCSTTL